MKPGKLIVIEGIDRSGKTTLCKYLVARLHQKGVDAEACYFPSRTSPYSKDIEAYLHGDTEASPEEAVRLFAMDRAYWLARMSEDLARGITLVVDRFTYSGIAYGMANGLDKERCNQIETECIGNQTPLHPDIVILLDMDPKDAAKRNRYGQQRYETVEFQLRVRDAFYKLFDYGWVLINAGLRLGEVLDTAQDMCIKALLSSE